MENNMSSNLSITVLVQQDNEHVTILSLKGDLDGSNYKDLEAKADDAIKSGAKNILIDLADVNYMGSAGLRAFHTIGNTLKSSGGTIKLLNPSDGVSRVLKTLGFDQFFEIFQDLGEAVRSF